MRTEKHHLRSALIWLLACVLMLGALAVLLPQARINTSVLALLPQQSEEMNVNGQVEAFPQELQDIFMQRLDRQLVWLVSPGPENDLAPVVWWHAQLQRMDVLAGIHGPMTAEQQQAWGRFYYEHRNAMLDEQTRMRLEGGTQAQWELAQIYSAFAGVSGQEILNDPLLLVRGAQMAQLAQQSASGRMGLEQGWLVTRDDTGRAWYWLYGELTSSSYDLKTSHATVQQLQQLEQQLHARWPQAQVLSRGTLFYSDYASQQAQNDISTLGTATVCGVLLLIFLTFRSVRPLFLCILSVGSGALAGTVATLLVFGEVHLMTLVLSISVVGVSTDYAIYYLTERMVHGAHHSPFESAHKIAQAQWLALVTTVLAYMVMVLAPFPGLRQLAVFASAGLCAAGLTVIYGFPYLVKNLPVCSVPVQALFMKWLLLWRTSRWLRLGLPLALLSFSVYGISLLHVDDDIAQLQTLPQDILQQEHRIAALTGQRSDQKWFAVYGASPEQTLQRLEVLQPALAQASSEKLLVQYRLLPLLSVQRQQQDLALLNKVAPRVIQDLRAAGVSTPEPDLQPMTVLPEQWLASEVSQGWRLLWASLPDGRSAILVPVADVTDSRALHEIAGRLDGVSWVDRKASYDELFYFYRTMLGWLLVGVVAVMVLIYLIRFGWQRGVVSVIPSLLSLSTGLAVLGVSGQALNLFALMALILVLGIGINYTLFFSNPQGTPTTSMFATMVAFLTTQLTLGMLVFSHTQAISTFGVVLSSGILAAFLLSPLALTSRRSRK